METTTIAGRDVPIQPGPTTKVTFSAGRAGPQEAGVYEFWTLVLPLIGPVDVARQRAGEDPGERWRRMELARGYEEPYERAKKAEYLRPATATELLAWLKSHYDDAKHAGACEVAGKAMNVSGPPYRLE